MKILFICHISIACDMHVRMNLELYTGAEKKALNINSCTAMVRMFVNFEVDKEGGESVV